MNVKPFCSIGLLEALNSNTPLRKLDFNPEESHELASFGLLSRKPILTVFNLDESQTALSIQLDHPSVALMGKLEMEIVQLSADDAEVFMKEYGIEELSLSKMIKLSYDLLQQTRTQPKKMISRLDFLQSNHSSLSAKMKSARGQRGAARARSKQRAKSTPIFNAALCAPKWWLVMICLHLVE